MSYFISSPLACLFPTSCHSLEGKSYTSFNLYNHLTVLWTAFILPCRADSLFTDSWGTFSAIWTWFSELYLTYMNDCACCHCFVPGMWILIGTHSCVYTHLHVFTFMGFGWSVSYWSNENRGSVFGSESETTALVQWSDSWVRWGRLDRNRFDLISFA